MIDCLVTLPDYLASIVQNGSFNVPWVPLSKLNTAVLWYRKWGMPYRRGQYNEISYSNIVIITIDRQELRNKHLSKSANVFREFQQVICTIIQYEQSYFYVD